MKTNPLCTYQKNGFTLVEMLAVVLIVGILMTVAVPQYRRTIQRTRATEAIAMLKVLADSAERLATSHGSKTLADFASSHGSVYNFSRLDMIDTSQYDQRCSFASSGTEMQCDYFTYTLNSDGSIDALQTNPNTGVTLTIYPDKNPVETDYITCSESSGTYYCDLYGYGTDESGE